MSEVWLPCPGFETAYVVSDTGKVRSVSRTVIQPAAKNPSRSVERRLRAGTIKPSDNGHGYKSVMLRGDGRSYRRYVHRLVLEAFAGPPPTPDHQAAHNDGNPSNNRLDNLRWATPAENAADIDRHGTRWSPPPAQFCPKGHPYDGDNIRVHRLGYPVCVTCAREAVRKYDEAKRPSEARRKSLPKAVRAEVARRAGNACQMCSAALADYEVDHIVPVYLGGSDGISNLRALCPGCHKEVTRRQSFERAKMKRIEARDGMRRRKPNAKDRALAKMLERRMG